MLEHGGVLCDLHCGFVCAEPFILQRREMTSAGRALITWPWCPFPPPPHTPQDLGSVLGAEFPKGVDIVYEGVGGAVREALIRNLAPGGRLLQVGRALCVCGPAYYVPVCVCFALRSAGAGGRLLTAAQEGLIQHGTPASLLGCPQPCTPARMHPMSAAHTLGWACPTVPTSDATGGLHQ